MINVYNQAVEEVKNHGLLYICQVVTAYKIDLTEFKISFNKDNYIITKNNGQNLLMYNIVHQALLCYHSGPWVQRLKAEFDKLASGIMEQDRRNFDRIEF